jgi:hypothetical protein
MSHSRSTFGFQAMAVPNTDHQDIVMADEVNDANEKDEGTGSKDVDGGKSRPYQILHTNLIYFRTWD